KLQMANPLILLSLMKTFGNFLLERLESSANLPAIGWIHEERLLSYTFKEYADFIYSLSLALKKQGIHHGSKVAILGHTCKEWHFFDLACLALGAVVVPIYPSYPLQDVTFILQHAECDFCIVEDKIQWEKIKDFKNIFSFKFINDDIKSLSQLIKEGQTLPFKESFTQLISSCNEDSIATIIYTSGTTGVPKGAVITHGAFIKTLSNVAEHSEGLFTQQDRSLIFLPLSHVLGRVDSYLHLTFGWQAFYARSIDLILTDLVLVKPTIMISVPRIFEKAYEKIIQKIEKKPNFIKKIFFWFAKKSTDYQTHPNFFSFIIKQIGFILFFSKIKKVFGNRIRYFISGGAPLSPTIIQFFKCANLTIIEGYGLTETIGPIFINPLKKPTLGSVGIPAGDVEVRIAPDGEILVHSQAMFAGYYHDEKATSESVIDGWFYTGDLGHLEKDNYLFITGRKKDLIVTSGGKKVAPQKIENLIKTKTFFSHAIILGDKQKYITALFTIELDKIKPILEKLNIPSQSSLQDIIKQTSFLKEAEKSINALNQELASFETIKKWEIIPLILSIDNGYLTPSMKVKKKKIEEDFKEIITSFYQS
ncbi:MAG: long-chain fatty acid--CoA ligase, partial [Bacteriovoracaceae bacterium]|nr:long-chain fatty acid--CoA ligase [Bacteriovoracaceae bacterium]